MWHIFLICKNLRKTINFNIIDIDGGIYFSERTGIEAIEAIKAITMRMQR